MRALALLLALMPAHSFADHVYPDGYAFVYAPCYPENEFELCPVPVADGHNPGYLPRTVPSTARLVIEEPVKYFWTKENRFSILITPNIVPYEEAIQDAASVAAGHCGREPGEQIVARIDMRQRYAPEDLESWKFGGTCE
ncbi:hypothetical protein PAA8504_00691 [Palleronia abyssalis]|uniref:DUF4189 domain-containing protein n=2 Tax=Palleronia abyssalis TaxID=1501240 RepID=A0A2R8BRW7_9RHOB|nr:hypothetical protein PAA8504_00691 [Palleronia abyssalis]